MDWLAYYDAIAEEVSDEILDEADELFNINEFNLNIPDDYFIYVDQAHFRCAS